MGREYIKNWAPRDYRTLEDLTDEIDRIEAADRAGTLEAVGNWSPGQIMEHCAKLIRFSIDGFEASAPAPLRWVGILFFKPRLGKSHMKPGIKLPASARSLMPRDEVPTEQGISAIREQLARIEGGEKMTQPSPILGKMSHEQWILLHLDHCRMHFGFLKYPG